MRFRFYYCLHGFGLNIVYRKVVKINAKYYRILYDSEGTRKADESIYEPLYKLYNHETLVSAFTQELPDFKELEKNKSFFKITEFGKSFINACTS